MLCPLAELAAMPGLDGSFVFWTLQMAGLWGLGLARVNAAYGFAMALQCVGFALRAVYKKHGMTTVKFPPNSGDLNPIETVGAAIWPCRRWRICRLGVSSALANTSAAPH